MTTIRRMDITTAEHRERVSLVGEALTAYRAMAAFDRSIELDPALGDAITKIGDREVPDDLYERAAVEFAHDELANLILAITAINAWNRIAVSSGMIFKAA